MSTVGRNASFIDKLAYKWIGTRLEGRLEKFEDLRRQLQRAGVNKSLRMFLSVTIFNSILAAIVVFFFSLVVKLFIDVLYPQIPFPIILPFFFAAFAGFATYNWMILNLSFKISERKRKIDASLPIAASYMTAMASAGVTPDKIFLSLSKDDLDLYLKEDAKKIARDVEIFNLDIIRALEAASKRSPSSTYSSFLEGIISTFTSGGDLQLYLQNASETLMKEKLTQEKAYIETLGLLAELFLVLCIVTPTFLVVILAMVAMQGTINHDGLASFVLTIGAIIIPLFQSVIIIMVDGSQPVD